MESQDLRLVWYITLERPPESEHKTYFNQIHNIRVNINIRLFAVGARVYSKLRFE